jgi:tripartite-type tricarboxylate transporter receptor subunit TctC
MVIDTAAALRQCRRPARRRRAADGYTLLWGSVGALTINQILEKISHKYANGVCAGRLTLTFCNALIVRNDSPIQSIAQPIARAKAVPGEINYARRASARRVICRASS